MKEILRKITAESALEAKWLNTLSLLEFIGARKIAKTVGQDHPSLMVLEHHADETRHAYAFKKLCQELSEESRPEYLCRDAAVKYFQTLDHQLSEWLRDRTGTDELTYPSYLLTTSLIERRAMKLYPLYRDATSQEAVREELHVVIEEESTHRPLIDRELKKWLERHGQDGLEACWQLEDELFQAFENALRASLA